LTDCSIDRNSAQSLRLRQAFDRVARCCHAPGIINREIGLQMGKHRVLGSEFR